MRRRVKEDKMGEEREEEATLTESAFYLIAPFPWLTLFFLFLTEPPTLQIKRDKEIKHRP